MILFDAGANLTRRVNGMPICFVGESISLLTGTKVRTFGVGAVCILITSMVAAFIDIYK